MKALVPYFIVSRFSNDDSGGEFTAATMFIDISGFTAMTQALMRNGKEGAEILSECINQIFTPAIAAIYQQGGFISTFAGDAFTAIFPMEQSHTQAALVAAQRIQQAFTHHGSQHTRFGTFDLKVKVGLSHGNVRWGVIAQDAQCSYYFRGAAVDGCAHSEHHAQTGDIIFDAAFQDALVSSNLICQYREVATDYFRLDACQLTGSAPVTAIQPVYPREVLQRFEPDSILDRTLKGEFRDIISVFISFGETDNLHAAIKGMIQAAHRFGGYFNKIDFGDKGGVALVLFGAPVGREKLNQRACDFALEIRDMAANLDVPLRAGCTMGKVFAGFVGSEQRCEYTALGMTVNLSARFMMKAQWGELFLDRRIVANVDRLYEITYMQDFQFKGFSEEIPVYTLLSKKAHAEDVTFNGTMVGREAEGQQLAATLAPLENNQPGGLVYIDGIAGIGKSRLVASLKDSLDLQHYHWCYLPCDEILRQSFNPFVTFLSRWSNQSPDATPQTNKEQFDIAYVSLIDQTVDADLRQELIRGKSLLGALLHLYWERSLYDLLDARSRYEQTLYGLTAFFCALAQQKPVIIELEDAHWIDADSIRALDAIMHPGTPLPLLVLSACRYNDDETLFVLPIDGVQTQRIELQYLPADAAKVLITATFEQLLGKTELAVPLELMAFILEKSDGNPFYIEQLVYYMIDHKVLDAQMKLTRQSIDIPSNINAVIIARIDRLTEDVKEVIKTASVIGKEFGVKILSEMLQSLHLELRSEKLQNVINTGTSEKIWNSIQEIKYIFKHALIRESVYEIQLKERLRELHALAADTIIQLYGAQNTAFAEELAYHFERAENHPQAAHYLDVAGYAAKYNFQTEKALDLYRRKSEQLLLWLDATDIASVAVTDTTRPILADYFDTQLERKFFLHILGDFAQAEECVDAAAAVAQALDDDERIGKAHLDRVNILQARGDLDAAEEQLHLAEAIFTRIDQPVMRGLTYRNLGVISLMRGKGELASDFFQKELITFRQYGEQRDYADALGNVAVMLRHGGKLNEAEDLLLEQIALAETMSNKLMTTRALINLGWVCEGAGKIDQAIEYYEQALPSAREMGQKSEVIRILDNIGFALQCKGDFTTARRYHANALEIAEKINDQESIVNILANSGHAAKGAGDLAEADELYSRGLDLARAGGFRFSIAELLVEQAELALKLHQPLRAGILCKEGLQEAQACNYTEYIEKAQSMNIGE